MSTMFVTGGAGFIGSHLVDRLLKMGHKVTVYDNLSSGRVEDISHQLDSDNFSFVQADLLDFDLLKEAMKGHEFIWHFGAHTFIPVGAEITDIDLKNNTIGTYNVLEAMRLSGIAKLIFASSATVYGDVPPTPLSEDYGPLLPVSLYGASKLACEGLISAYSHLFGIQAWVFRFATVVGGRMGHGVILDFIERLRKNPNELQILGDGNQERPFFLVEDCIEGMLCALNNCSSQYSVFNLAHESTTTITRVAQIVADEMGLKDVHFGYTGGRQGRPGDMPGFFFGVERIKSSGWTARYSSDEAVRIATGRLLEERA